MKRKATAPLAESGHSEGQWEFCLVNPPIPLRSLLCLLLLSMLTAGCVGTSRPAGANPAARSGAEPIKRTEFLPPPLTDNWTKWIVGEWEGAGGSDAGKGKGTVRFELALGGQFLIARGEAELTELNPDYLKKHMHATDEQMERFKRTGYQSLEIYTIDQETGEVLGFLFDDLRCIATGRGQREGYKETVAWEWRTGHKSTRITERVSDDRLTVIERTPNPDGTVMEDKGEFFRARSPAPTNAGVDAKTSGKP